MPLLHCFTFYEMRLTRVFFPPSDKVPSVRQLSSKSSELQLPLLRQNGDKCEDSAADDYNDEEEEQEISLH